MAIRKIYTCMGKRGALIDVKRVHFARSGSQSEGRILPRLPTPGASHTAISKKVVKKKCTRQSRKVLWVAFDFTVGFKEI